MASRNTETEKEPSLPEGQTLEIKQKFLEPGSKIPGIVAEGIHGKKLDTKNLKKPLFLMFAAIRSTTCKDMIVGLQEGLELSGGKGKIDVAYVLSSSKEDAQDYAAKLKINDRIVITDAQRQLAKMFQVPFTPMAFMYSEEGILEQVIFWQDQRLFLFQLAAFVDRKAPENWSKGYVPEFIKQVLYSGAPIPMFEAKNHEGNTVSNSEFSSQKTVFTFTGYNARIGIEELPKAVNNARKNQNLDDQMQFVHLFKAYGGTVKEIVSELGIQTPCIPDPDGEIAKKFMVYGQNHYAMYDSNGEMVTGVDFDKNPEEVVANLALFASDPDALIEKIQSRNSGDHEGQQH